MNTNNKQILQTANAAVSKGDFEGFLKHCAEDIEWNMIGDTSLKGKSAVREWMIETYVNPPKFAADHFVSEGDFVTVFGDIDIKDQKGNTTHSKYCDVWKFKDGLMTELRAYAIETKS